MKTMKRLVMVLLVLALFSGIPGVQAVVANGASLSGIQIFPEDHIWNVPIDTLPVDSKSAVYIRNIGSSTYLRADFGEWGLPYNVVDNSQAMHTVTFTHPEVSDQVPYPIPDNPLMELDGIPETCTDTGEDCHVTKRATLAGG